MSLLLVRALGPVTAALALVLPAVALGASQADTLDAAAAGQAASTQPSALGDSLPVLPPDGSASASLGDCRVAVKQADRSATFSGQMASTAASVYMAMRVDLLERDAGAAGFRVVSAPGLSVWRRSAATVQIFRYVKQVSNLPAPAEFRATISFRWLDGSGRVTRRQARRTSTCVQPDQRPSSRPHAREPGSPAAARRGR